MNVNLKDGAGGGASARVDSKNRVHSAGVARKERDAAISEGGAFLFGSTVIEYTHAFDGDFGNGANYKPIVVIKNTSDRELIVSNIFASFGLSNISDSAYFTVWKNMDDSSQIFTDANACPVTNMDIGSPELFEGEAYIGSSTSGFTGGAANHTTIVRPDVNNIIDVDIPFSIPKGQNLFFTLVPPTGNTSMEVMLAITVYYLDSELSS